VNEPCINSTTGEARVVEGATNEFCTTPLLVDGTGVPVVSSLNSVICDPAYESWTICDLSNVRTISPNELLYFPDPSWTTVAFPNADNCPIPSLQLGLQCSNEDSSTYTVFYDGESVGTGSRCVNAYYNRASSGRAYQPACMSVTCDADAGLVRLGSNYVCTYDGEELPIANRSDGATIICPRLAAVCPELFTCPDGCFGRGECVYSGSGRPTCRCLDGNNTHASCAPAVLLNRPTTGPTTPAPVTLVSGGGGGAPTAPVTAIKSVATPAPRRAPIPAPVVAQSGAPRWERPWLFAGLLLSGWYLIG
jgi:Leishmanolysin